MSEQRPATQETPQTIDDWEKREIEQIGRYKSAIEFLMQMREKRGNNTICGETAITAAAIAYPDLPTDRFAIFGVLSKAVVSGLILPEEVGGKEGVIYDINHSDILMVAAVERGEVVQGSTAYMHLTPSGKL